MKKPVRSRSRTPNPPISYSGDAPAKRPIAPFDELVATLDRAPVIIACRAERRRICAPATHHSFSSALPGSHSMRTLSNMRRISALEPFFSSARVPAPIRKKINPFGTIQISETVGTATSLALRVYESRA